MLVKELALPLPSSMTEALGIHQSDIIIRTALVRSLADLRANPWLLDYVFRSLARDTITAEEYGEFEIAQAKKWFLATEIPVTMSDRLDSPTFPIISIKLMESTESDATLGDVHYQPVEATEADWPILAGPLTPERYDPVSGSMLLKAADVGVYEPMVGHFVLDRTGAAHEILGVVDLIVTLASGTVADFSRVLIKGSRPRFVTSLESLSFRETYAIGCHVSGEVVHLTYLHSIVLFVLLRYKELLLEARGFERTTLSSAEFSRNQAFDNEVVYSRFVNITGYVRQYWPKIAAERVEVVKGPIQFGTSGTSGPGADGDQLDPFWLSDRDALTLK